MEIQECVCVCCARALTCTFYTLDQFKAFLWGASSLDRDAITTVPLWGITCNSPGPRFWTTTRPWTWHSTTMSIQQHGTWHNSSETKHKIDLSVRSHREAVGSENGGHMFFLHGSILLPVFGFSRVPRAEAYCQLSKDGWLQKHSHASSKYCLW